MALCSTLVDLTNGAVRDPATGRASTSENVAAEPKRNASATTTRPTAAAAIPSDLRVPAKLRAERGDRAARERVDALVQRVAGVAGHLAPDDVVALRLGEQPFPEVAIGDRLLLGVLPAVLLPAFPPALAEAVHDVGAVRVQADAPAGGDRREAFDRPHELHALVGGPRVGAGDGALLTAVDDDRGPTAGPGVAGARAVGVEDDLGRRGGWWSVRPSGRQAGSCQ